MLLAKHTAYIWGDFHLNIKLPNELLRLDDIQKILYYYDLDYVAEISFDQFSKWIDEIIRKDFNNHDDFGRTYIRIGDKGLMYIKLFNLKNLCYFRGNYENIETYFVTKKIGLEISFIHKYTEVGEWYWKDYLYFMNEWKDKCSNWSIVEYRLVDPFNGCLYYGFNEVDIAYIGPGSMARI